MTIEWNPGDPDIEGLEHPSIGHAHVTQGGYADQWAVTFKARHTGGITDVQIHLPPTAVAQALGSTFSNLNAPLIAELHAEGDEDTGEPTQDVYAINNVVASSQMTDFGGVSAPNAADIATLNDGQGAIGYVQNAYMDLQFDTAAYSLTRRIIRMGLEVWTDATYRAIRADGGVGLWDTIVPAASSGFAPWAFYHGEAIVKGGTSAWAWQTPQFIRDFRSGGPNFYRIAAWVVGGFGWLCDMVRMHVVSVPENRIGVGIATFTPGTAQWVNIPLKSPAGTGNPTVTSGQRYTLIVRRTTGDSHYTNVGSVTAPMRYLRGVPLEVDDYLLRPVATSVPAGVSNPNFEGWYWLAGNLKVDGLGTQVEGVTAARFVSGGAYQPESQPYELFGPGSVWGGTKDIVPTTNAPSTGCDITQAISIAGTGEVYGQVVLNVGVDMGPGNTPNGPLRVEVRNPSGALVLGPVDLQFFQWFGLPATLPYSDTDRFDIQYKKVRLQFASGAALSAGVHAVKVTGPGVSESRQWRVGLINSRTEVGDVELTSMGGSSEFASGFVIDSTDFNYGTIPTSTRFGDAQVTLATVPPAPANMQAADIETAAHHANVCTCDGTPSGCAEVSVPGILLGWDTVADPLVAIYEVQRKDVLETDWTTVAVVEHPNHGWTDYEARIGLSTCYRVRAVRGDGLAGDWSTEACDTIAAERIALCFTSNSATGMSVVLPEIWETDGEIERTWTLAEFSDVEERLFYGRDGQPSFHPTERRGDVFSRILLLNALGVVQRPTTGIVDPLRDLAWAPIPYVCVRDGEGNRWFASVRVPTLTNKRRGERWFAEIDVVEAARIPAITDTSVAQVTSV